MSSITIDSPVFPADSKPVAQVHAVPVEEIIYTEGSDDGVANLVRRMYGHRIAYLSKMDEFRVFDPGAWKWKVDALYEVRNMVAASMYVLKKAAAAEGMDTDMGKRLMRVSTTYLNASRLEAVCRRLADHPDIRTAVEDWDANGDLTLFADGWVVNMKTGLVRRPRPEDRLTASLGIRKPRDFNKSLDDSPMMKALSEILEGVDPEMVQYLRKSVFYTLLGAKAWKAWFTVWGPPNTAKSTLLKIIKKLAGDYGHALNFSSFEDDGNAERRFDLAGLMGKRYAMIDESAQDKALDAKRMKWVTGGTDLKVEKKYRDPFEIRSEFAVWLGTNYKPRLKNDDGAVWARLRLFTLQRVFKVNPEFEKQLLSDKNLEDFFLWVWGAKEAYWSEGIGTIPESMDLGLEEYRKETDWLGMWLEEELEPCAPEEGEYLMELYQALEFWMKIRGFIKWRPTYLDFLSRLRERGLDTTKRRRQVGKGDKKFAYLPGCRLRVGADRIDLESFPREIKLS